MFYKLNYLNISGIDLNKEINTIVNRIEIRLKRVTNRRDTQCGMEGTVVMGTNNLVGLDSTHCLVPGNCYHRLLVWHKQPWPASIEKSRVANERTELST